MPEPTKISVRISPENAVRLDALCAAIEAMGTTARRTTVAGDALVAGLEVLEERFRATKSRGKRAAGVRS
jgi:hypothetical protein